MQRNLCGADIQVKKIIYISKERGLGLGFGIERLANEKLTIVESTQRMHEPGAFEKV